MAYPQDPLPVVVEMWTGSWVDITDKVFVRDGGISIRRGFPDEGTTPEPSSMTMTLDNRTGDFTPRNPMSQYYGLIGRNTPVRVRVGDGLAGDGYLHIEEQSSLTVASARAFYFAGNLDVAGDIDVRVDALSFGWSTGSSIAARYEPFGDERSWALLVTTSGFLTFAWSTDGTSGGVLSATSTVAAGLTNGARKAIRATLDVDNGSSGWTVTFYTADDIDDTWVQLGDPVSDSGVTSIFLSTSALDVGHDPDFVGTYPQMRIYAVQVLDGIDGTAVADVDFGAQEPGDNAFADAVGVGWQLTFGGSEWITNPGHRYVGEVSEWPTRWDVSGQDVFTSVTAQGILRRLGQGSRPVRSPMKSAMLAHFPSFGLVGYWPMEEGSLATSFASALTGATPLTYSGDRPDSGENGIGPLLGSDRVAVLGATTTLSGSMTGSPITGTEFSLGCIMDVPTTTGWSDNTAIIYLGQDSTGSTVTTWEIRYKSGSGGDLQVRALDESGSQLAASGTLDFNIDGKQLWLYFGVVQSGSDAAWTVTTLTIGDDGLTVDTLTATGTFSSLVVNAPTRVRVAPSGGLSELAIGHVAVLSQDSLGTIPGHSGNVESAIVARAGETAAVRANRLAEEVGLDEDSDAALRIIGTTLGAFGDDDTTTTAMGSQAIPSTFTDAYNETWAAELALAYETRDQRGLSWRTRRSLYNQPVALTLDYTGPGEIAPDLEPIDDDQNVRNDIEVKRKGGSSYRAVDSTSRMGTAAPPDGVGRYEDQPEVNLFSDDQLEGQAHWRLHLGTWDEARYPRVVINMAALVGAGKYDLMAQVCALEVGDRIQLTNLPAFTGTPGTVDLMVLGFQPETIGHPVDWTVTLNCVPYGPYDVGTYQATPIDENTKRYDTLGSTLTSDVDAGTDTSFQVTIAAGHGLWTLKSASWVGLQVEAGGVIWDVTSITGSSSPQTINVTATAANGVVKNVAAGTQIRVAPQQRAVRGL